MKLPFRVLIGAYDKHTVDENGYYIEVPKEKIRQAFKYKDIRLFTWYHPQKGYQCIERTTGLIVGFKTKGYNNVLISKKKAKKYIDKKGVSLVKKQIKRGIKVIEPSKTKIIDYYIKFPTMKKCKFTKEN